MCFQIGKWVQNWNKMIKVKVNHLALITHVVKGLYSRAFSIHVFNVLYYFIYHQALSICNWRSQGAGHTPFIGVRFESQLAGISMLPGFDSRRHRRANAAIATSFCRRSKNNLEIQSSQEMKAQPPLEKQRRMYTSAETYMSSRIVNVGLEL